MPKTILGIGAHYDDCVFGISGTLLKAVRKNHRVVILSLIGDYSNWKPAAGRHKEIVAGTVKLGQEYGVEMKFLDFTGMRFDVNQASKIAVAEAISEIQPDVAFMLWPHDSHPDHEVASALSKTALGHGDRLLEGASAQRFRGTGRVFQYDNGPRHTIGFEPNTFVDVTDEWPQAIAWLGKLMALVQNVPFDPAKPDGAMRMKESISAYRGAACGVRYAEAFRSTNAYPQEIL
jgi:LmbE family N-acetylglucosaminyl deacetylase